ncbi:GDP-L-fucose synthase family protein [Christiangramia forsetii]|uniref:GDP-L-fucose synthase n=2 Tax=Christiangramia forsetii TaxID=411153 RepID=A0LYU4_CHRFK|nr:GDP-L-fucose synthase [Christiangramia forsetii]GGG33342.1 GDP-L-fucose synthase [Christiangramia forsetii]CAL65539.1 GDP-L-fucose synthetase [Christiangramia forsetii KT0803]
MEKDSKIYVAGHRGMVGSALVRKLEAEGFTNLVLRTSKELNLTDQQGVEDFFQNEKPEYVFLAAAKVGGIEANNTYRAQFLYENLMIQNNVIHQSYVHRVKKLLFLASSCIYPKLAPQPIKEEYLLSGKLEPTNEPYAIAKIAGVKMCENYNRQYGCNFISVMPTNLYGPNDNYDLKESHVLPALLRKFHEAKINLERTGHSEPVELWGSGKPRREFLHVDDLAEACYHLMLTFEGNISVNVGTGKDISIKELAELIKEITNFEGKLVWNTDKPDGTPRKLLDVSLIENLGWKYSIKLQEGISKVYRKKFLS